jgi:biopolymer transport protein TolQ
MRRVRGKSAAGMLVLVATAGTSPAWGRATASGSDTAAAIALDPLSLIANASGPVFFVVWLLIGASVAVWFIAALKLMQLRRWTKAEEAFETEANRALSAEEVFELAKLHGEAPGARIAAALQQRASTADPHAVVALLPSAAHRALVIEEKRASTMMSNLASIGAASPFIGLFGTVYGIMDAFLRIGREKSASLPVVAPAIGEALIATAIGLFAAIPAVIAYNAIAKRLDDLMAGVEASTEGWVALASVTFEAEPAQSAPNLPKSQPLPLATASAQAQNSPTKPFSVPTPTPPPVSPSV